mmetsp:Transcript_11343/g.30963  ORF Transcript_11343/g.30963 Transcript_11343/m.30963 type:complete len:312 (-) Transcript_11343:2-937(-)
MLVYACHAQDPMASAPTPSLARVAQAQLHLRRHGKALQTLHRHAGLVLVLVVDECHVAAWDQAHLLEARVLSEEHRQHGVGGLHRQVFHEERPVGLQDALHRRRWGPLLHVGRLLRVPANAVLDALLRGCRSRRRLHLLRHWSWCRRRSGGRLALPQVLALHDLLRPLDVGAVGLRDHVGLGLGAIYPHGLVVEGEALQGLQGVCCAGDFLEDDPGLPAALEGLHRDNVDDAAEGREHLAQRLLQRLDVDFVVKVVHVERLVRREAVHGLLRPRLWRGRRRALHLLEELCRHRAWSFPWHVRADAIRAKAP